MPPDSAGAAADRDVRPDWSLDDWSPPVTSLATTSVVCAAAWPACLAGMFVAVGLLDSEVLFRVCVWAMALLPPAGIVLAILALFRVRSHGDVVKGTEHAILGLVGNGLWLLVCGCVYLLGHTLSKHGI